MIRNVEQRFDTILRVSQAIVERQTAFFSQGPAAMRPLILKDIAGELGLHESTISRATTQKYMLTPFGTLELKRFFGAGVDRRRRRHLGHGGADPYPPDGGGRESRQALVRQPDHGKAGRPGHRDRPAHGGKYREALRIAPAARKAQASVR